MGMKPGHPSPEMPIIQAENIDEEWLKLCAVGIVKEHTELGSIQAAMNTGATSQIWLRLKEPIAKSWLASFNVNHQWKMITKQSAAQGQHTAIGPKLPPTATKEANL
ncbi:hypothetical protein U1Q18_012813 [Sarracenia purpurea var. burkii]